MPDWTPYAEGSDADARMRLMQDVRDTIDRAVIDPERAYNLYGYMRVYVRDCCGWMDRLFTRRHPQHLHGFDYGLNMMRRHYPVHAERLEAYMRECGFEPEPYHAHVRYWKNPYRDHVEIRPATQQELGVAALATNANPPTFRPATWWERWTKKVYVKEEG